MTVASRSWRAEDRPIHTICTHGALVEVTAPRPRPPANHFDRLLAILGIGSIGLVLGLVVRFLV